MNAKQLRKVAYDHGYKDGWAAAETFMDEFDSKETFEEAVQLEDVYCEEDAYAAYTQHKVLPCFEDIIYAKRESISQYAGYFFH